MKIDVVSRSGKSLAVLDSVTAQTTILEVKKLVHKKHKNLPPVQQAIKKDLERTTQTAKDEDTLEALGLMDGDKLYLKNLGPQIGWSTVFLAEYAGPLFSYMIFYPQWTAIYGDHVVQRHWIVNVAALCWSAHYLKRIWETIFVHRFSNATMPLTNLFKNCSYYWGFAAFVGAFVNHPLFSPPSDMQAYLGLAGFIISELGNLYIHLALRDLRPAGSKERKIPQPTRNPFTALFALVACPNYTYEVASWLCFAVMTQSLPALIFALVGFGQMTVWAQGKLRNYRREFAKFPKSRRAIIPFLI